jgi:tRNA G10  N-methylase Trm11
MKKKDKYILVISAFALTPSQTFLRFSFTQTLLRHVLLLRTFIRSCTFMNATEALMLILENPYAKKGYQEFAKYLKNVGKQQESDAFQHLITKRFGDAHSANSRQEQSTDNREVPPITSTIESEIKDS